MVIFKTGRLFRDIYSFETLNKFDGIIIDGDGFFTCIPISKLEYRESEDYKRNRQGQEVPFVRLWKGETHTEFLITDDWSERHILLIPNAMTETIDKAKSAILTNKIPANFQ